MIKDTRPKEERYVLASEKGKVVRDIVARTNFKINEEIYRNFDIIKGNYYIRSLIYKGNYSNTYAVLKIHGASDAADDYSEIKKFEAQNKSTIVRAPRILDHMKWEGRLGYGFTIFEFVDAPRIFPTSFHSNSELENFVSFYQDYKTKAITEPWKTKPRKKIGTTIFKSIDTWLDNAKTKRRLKENDYMPYLLRFKKICAKQLRGSRIEFMHMHLYPEHVLKTGRNNYVILDHMSWGYRLQWADLSYMLWKSILEIKDNNYSFANFVGYVDKWIETCKKIPIVKKDKDFDRKIRFLILERSVGIIIGDLGAGKFWGTSDGKKFFKHKLALQQKMFNHIADELDSYS